MLIIKCPYCEKEVEYSEELNLHIIDNHPGRNARIGILEEKT